MSGNGKSVSDRIKEIDALLTNYENSLGLKSFQQPEYQQYLECGEDAMRKMDKEDAAIAAITLNQYCFYLQKMANIENSRIEYIESLLKEVVTNELQINKYVAPSAQERRDLAIFNNESAKKLNESLVRCKSRLVRLSFLSNNINNLSQRYENLSRAKRGNI